MQREASPAFDTRKFLRLTLRSCCHHLHRLDRFQTLHLRHPSQLRNLHQPSKESKKNFKITLKKEKKIQLFLPNCRRNHHHHRRRLPCKRKHLE